MCHVVMVTFVPALAVGPLTSLWLTFQHWSVYEDINELFILIPALLGLKGNLEMTLASRLSTAVSPSLGPVLLSVFMPVLILCRQIWGNSALSATAGDSVGAISVSFRFVWLNHCYHGIDL